MTYLIYLFDYCFDSYLKLDVVHITVQNTFQWLSGSKSDLNAVHLDILTILVRIVAWLSGVELFTRFIQEFGYNWLDP